MVVSIKKEQILAEFTNEHTVTAVTWGLHAASMSTDLKMVLSMTYAQHFIWYSQGFRNTSSIKKKKKVGGVEVGSRTAKQGGRCERCHILEAPARSQIVMLASGRSNHFALSSPQKKRLVAVAS